ncbi:hypothetical protein G4B88_030379 [Cannabis sativa]|uniref:Adenosylhomocysteinase n=1 Tax=Cannabis sativa TaxID=3483 RepID=A0A7J6E0I9_CANSA|nr:hypothetical protein G4B88_030379 [Cannabis sativa]
MSLSVEKTTAGHEYKVRDLSQADFSRLEIELAEVEMPGLVSCRTAFGPSQPFKGGRITGSLHMTIQTAVLTALGAEVRWCSSNIFLTQDQAAAAIARDSAAVFCLERCGCSWGRGVGAGVGLWLAGVSSRDVVVVGVVKIIIRSNPIRPQYPIQSNPITNWIASIF